LYPELKKLWIDHLSDNIQSIRENTAISIGQVLNSSFAEDMGQAIRDHIKENMLKAKEQKADSAKFSNLGNVTQFGVAPEEIKDHDHDNNTMFSCGSLAPKLKRGGGCMDHGFSRPKELWELSDGSVFMLRELSGMEQHQEFVVGQLDNLSNVAYVDHFKHSHVLKENIFKSLRKIVENLGKKKFRGFLEFFLDPAFRNAKGEHQNLAYAAQDFLLNLEKVYGQGIFKAIVEGHDDRYVKEF